MGLNLDYNYLDGQSPLDEEEVAELKIKSISTREELDEFEQQNIETAMEWLFKQKVSASKLLTEKFVKDLHRQMFGSVWSWAGQFRQSNKNIGVDKAVISIELKKLLDNCSYWIENKTFPEEEIAIRLKHRLVSIHPFPNGNGRHSRLMADTIMEKVFLKPSFSWGRGSVETIDNNRSDYIKAVREADQENFELLLKFAKS